jgi:hypothetical protein
VRKFLKIAVYALGGILAFLLLLAAVTQTQFFRDRLRAAALSTITSLFDAEVHLGELRGNLVTGFSVDSIAVRVQDSPLLVAERLDLRYNLLEIPGRKISVNAITLIRPVITLQRLPGGRWNFDRMIRPPTPDTLPSPPMTWVFKIDRLEIRDGIITLVDSVSLRDPEHRPADSTEVEYHQVSLHDFNLIASGDVRPNAKTIGISLLSFVSDRPEFALKKLEGEFTITPSEALVKNLVIETNRSNLRLNAELGKVDLLHGLRLEDLRQCPAKVDLRASDVDFEDLKMFLPPLRFLNGPANVNLVAGGEFGELQLQRLEVRFGHTQMLLKGSVLNLHEPGHLLLDVRIVESKIDPVDPLVLMPSFNLPDLSSLGSTRLAMEFQGSPLDFRTQGTIESGAGSVETDISLVVGGPARLQYKGALRFRDVNLAGVLSDESLDSKLSGNLRVEGEGVSLASVKSNLIIDIDSSMFRGQPLRDTHLSIAGSEQAIHGSSHVRLGPMTSNVTAGIREQGSSLPTFTLEGDVSSLYLGNLLGDVENTASVSFGLSAKGRGLNLHALGGEMDVNYSYARQEDSTESKGTVHLLLDQSDTLHKVLNLESTLGSVSLTGVYDLDSLVRMLGFHAKNLGSAFGDRFAFLDSSFALKRPAAPKVAPSVRMTGLPGTLHAIFTIRIDDLEPLVMFLPHWDGLGQAECHGTIISTPTEASLQGHLSIDEFAYGRVEGGTLIEGCSADFSLLHLKSSDPLRDLSAEVHGAVQSLNINTNELDSLRADVLYVADSAVFSVQAKVNQEIGLSGRGTAVVDHDTVTVRFNAFEGSYEDYSWRSDPGAQVKLGRDGLSIKDLVMRRDTEEVRLDATLGSGGTLSGLLTATRVDLDGLKYLLSSEDRTRMGDVFTGLASMRVRALGTYDSPEFAVDLSAENMSYRTVPFGTLSGNLTYNEHRLGVRFSVDEPTRANKTSSALVITGMIPIDLGFRAVQERIPDEPMHLSIRSDSLQIGILDPLLPTFDQLNGLMICDVSVTGTPRHPLYGGSLAIRSSSFLFVPNNITYLFDGEFQPEGDRIRVVDATVRNIPSDESGVQTGLIHLAGDFSITDLRPGDFDLSATGKLLVVKETTRKSSLSVYGRLFVEIGPGGLHFTGDIDQSLLKGDLLIRNSTLIFPPTRSSSQEQADLSIPIVVLNDTVKAEEERSRSAAERYFGMVNGRRTETMRQGILPTKSFLDGVRYDLDIETTGGTTEIWMIFNPVTSEELVAAIDGKFSITEDGKKWFGDLTIGRASYNFFKRFVAEGKINFTGDVQNPSLDITASYEGTRKVRDTVSTVIETTEKVVVTIKITGTRYVPKLEMSMKIADLDYATYGATHGPTSTSNDVQSDAVQFILYGSFPLTVSQKNDVANGVRSSVGTSILTGATSLLTGTLSDFLRMQTGFISSVDLSYGSGDNLGQRTDIRLSGVAFSGLWRYGGKILNDPLSNSNFSLLYSFGTILNDESLRNLMFELERKVQDVTSGQTSVPKGVNSARLFYRFSF